MGRYLTTAPSGGASPPTTLTGESSTLASTPCYIAVADFMGVQESAAITSATLTEVLNISGGGEIQHLAMMTSSGTTTTSSKLKIVIDGTTVLDDTLGSSNQFAYYGVVGSFFANASVLSFGEGNVPFLESLVVSIAGDGTNGSQLTYKRYLT